MFKEERVEIQGLRPFALHDEKNAVIKFWGLKLAGREEPVLILPSTAANMVVAQLYPSSFLDINDVVSEGRTMKVDLKMMTLGGVTFTFEAFLHEAVKKREIQEQK